MRTLSIPIACFPLAAFIAIPAQAGVAIVASQSLTVQPGGPRPGEAGSKYLNIEGKDNEKYASFGVLIFRIPKEDHGKQVKGVTLTLVQSIPRFAKDGAIRFLLAPDLDTAEKLKFDPSAPDGVGSQIKSLHPLGSGEFKQIATGKTESFSLIVDDAVRERIAKGGRLCLVVVPADAAVTATYFGANEDAKDKSPGLMLDLP
jgi:hypothetical protein